MSGWFLPIVPDMLKQLRESTNGYPAMLNNEDVWSHILTEMETHLREADESQTSKPQDYSYQVDSLEKGLTEFKDWFFDLWD